MFGMIRETATAFPFSSFNCLGLDLFLCSAGRFLVLDLDFDPAWFSVEGPGAGSPSPGSEEHKIQEFYHRKLAINI